MNTNNLVHPKVSEFYKKAITALHYADSNFSNAKIARIVGVSQARVSQIIKEQDKLIEQFEENKKEIELQNKQIIALENKIKEAKQNILSLKTSQEKIVAKLKKFAS